MNSVSSFSQQSSRQPKEPAAWKSSGAPRNARISGSHNAPHCLAAATVWRSQVMIQNWPKLERLTVMNSGVGYNLINERHDEIKRHVQIIIHGWSYGINDCGLMFETTILSKIYRYIDCLITDGGGYKKQLAEINGWDGKKIKPIALPIVPVEMKQDYTIKYHIMYAGRFSNSKRLDLILEVEIGRASCRERV